MKMVVAEVEKLVIPTYPEPEKEQMPMFAENRVHQRSSGRPYPNKIVLKVNREEKIDKEYTVIRMENEYVSLYILPEIGGRIYAAKDKTTGYDFFYKQHVIKPALIGVLGSWVSGGVEFNWPFHHRASGFMPCDYNIEYEKDGTVICWLSEHDPIDRMKGMVGIVLRPDSAYFETRMKLYNRTPLRHSFLWWENAAVPVNESYRIFFPKDVTYVNFHYLKSRANYPIAGSCTFNGIDMKEDRDISWHKNTRQATSYFASASKYDFFGGYDYSKDCGVVHIGNHHLSPGKKMFTWAYSQLATSWENALTDTDGQYAELMAGSYSDNQPDFAWLEPYETKKFSQYWYPISKIGTPCFANLNGAINIERSENCAELKLQSTKVFENAEIKVLENGSQIFSATENLNPQTPLAFNLGEIGEYVKVEVVVNGKAVISYLEEKVDNFKKPDPITDTPSAEKIATVQELYLAGVHVAQYRDPAVYPDAYWLEALRRDPNHIESLIAMADYRYRLCDYNTAYDYIKKAIEKLTFLNAHPESGKAYFICGLILEAMEKREEAYDYYYKAAWSGITYDVAMTRISVLDLYNKDYEKALEHTENALSRNSNNRLAMAVRVMALKYLDMQDEAEELIKSALDSDKLDHLIRFLATEEDLADFFAVMDSSATQTCLDLAFDLADMGELKRAENLLCELAKAEPDEATAPLYFSLAYIKKLMGEPADDCITLAETAPIGNTFPFRMGELKALKNATNSTLATELLGNLYYSKRQIEKAKECYETVLENEPENPDVIRNLAVLLFNYKGEKVSPLKMMKQAVKLNPNSEELIYETVVLMDKLSIDPNEKVAFLESKRNLITRDDILTELAKAYNQSKQPQKALDVLLNHNFVPCEGGEHAIADQYIFANFTLAQEKFAANDFEKAMEFFKKAQVLPQNLGAGIWNHCKLIPLRYFEAICLENLGKKDEAEEIYRYIANTEIEYFSNMHLKELPWYQALSFNRLGEKTKGVSLMTRYRRVWEEALSAKDSGYFATTPFFIPFTDSPEKMRQAQFGYLCGLCEDYMGNKEKAKELLTTSAELNSELLFAKFYSENL
jgi:tetratricopeptide (TPR) repeat protein